MGVVAQNAAEGIIRSLILGFAIAGVAWGVMRLLPPGKAALRFVVWLSALGGTGLVPLLQIILHVRTAGADFAKAAHGFIVLPADWAAYLLWSWAVVASVGLARVIVGAWHLHRVRSAGIVITPAELSPAAREVVIRAGQKRAFELRASDQMRVPAAIGFFRPAVVVPKELLDELSPDQLSQVLLHETTHLLRYDDWTNLVQKIARAVLFFHPAVWWLESKLTLEREMACDEAVVAETADPRSYAECLALLAEKTLLRRSLTLVQTAVNRLRHTSLRVQELVAPGPKKTARAWAAAAALTGVLACSAALVQAPDLVSFQSRTTALTGNDSQTTLVKSVPNVPSPKAPVRPQVLPAAFKPAGKPLSNYGARVKSQSPVVNHVAVAQAHSPAEEKLQFVLASHEKDEPVSVLVTTGMIVESDAGSGAPAQVWRMWQVTVYYPTTEKKATETFHKI